MPRYGPYSHQIVLARPDGRTREARLLKCVRQALINHLGGEDKLSPPQRALVERAAMLQLRLAVLDSKLISGKFTDSDSRTYLAWENSLRRVMVALGLTTVTDGKAADPLDAIRRHLSGAAA